jgi:hypothetical protein|tara:strand:+ start:475 stop:735 length:261 start_codon:yes stop_codon:yes gene_type:complete
MAFVKTIDIVSNNGTVYADVAGFKAAHGPCGTENEDFVTEASMTLLEGGTGVRVIYTYADKATHDSHGEVALTDLPGIDTTIISAV